MVAGEASITAKICAFARAHHSKFAKVPICEDAYAYELLGERDYEYVKKKIVQILGDRCWQVPVTDTWDQFLNEFISPIIIPRMKYAKDQLLEFIGDGDEPMQYVICGAGLDSFIFRNPYKGLQVFELDHVDTQIYKKNRIAELGWEVPENALLVAIDFEKQNMKDVLLEAGFMPERKTFFAILGITYYLSLATFAELAGNIAELSKNKESMVVFDYPDKEIVKRGHMNQRMEALQDIAEALGEKMLGGMNYKELAEVFHRYGFHISEHVTPQIIQERYFENCDAGMEVIENISFVTAEKNSRHK